MQMLPRPGGVAEPAIVGDIEEQPRPLAALRHGPGKDDLVANEGGGGGKAGDFEQRAWPRADVETAAQPRELPEPDRFQQRLQWQVFAKGHKVRLVVAGRERA